MRGLSLFKCVPTTYWVFITLIIGFLTGSIAPKNPIVHFIAQTGTIFPKAIVTFAAPVIFFLLAGATIRVIKSQKGRAGKIVGMVFAAFLIVGLASLTWSTILVKMFIHLPISNAQENTSLLFVTKAVFNTLRTMISQQPILHMLIAGVLVGWLAATHSKLTAVEQGITYISDKILFIFRWLNWYYPIMVGCLAILIPAQFGGKGVSYYGQAVLWVAICCITWTMIMMMVTKLITIRTWREILAYFMTVYPTGFGTGGSFQAIAVNLLSAEKDLKLNHQFADMSIIFGTVINKNAATMSVMVTTITTCWMMHIPISFTDILVLIVPLWILGLQTPGIPGGAAFFMSPVIAVILKVPNPELYVTTFITMYSGLIPMFASGTNTIVNGLIGAILQDRFVDIKKFESTQKGEVA